jgi:hypothetical protein
VFEITTEPAKRLVRLKLNGLLTEADVAELYRREHAAILAMNCRIGDHLLLIDSTENGLQTQAVIEAFKRQMAKPSRARRIAVVTGRSLSRMQARRLLADHPGRMFETIAEAEVWLLSEAVSEAA